MNRKELADQIRLNHNLTKDAAVNAVDAVLAEIKNALRNGDPVDLRHFGSFSVKHTPARPGTNPATGAKITLPQKSSVRFKGSPAILA